jgi:hypothetical protein
MFIRSSVEQVNDICSKFSYQGVGDIHGIHTPKDI